MNFYPFHIGDYLAHTAHLSPLEDIAYRRLLDLYYTNESPLPADASSCARLIRMRDNEDAVSQVLAEFFTLTDAGWTNARCDEEIEKMRSKQAKAKASGEASGRSRKSKNQQTFNDSSNQNKHSINERSTDVQQTFNDCSTTNTNTNITTTGDKSPDSCAVVEDSPWSLWADGLAVLVEAGIKDSQARSLIGKWRKDYGDQAVEDAFGVALANSPSDPAPYIAKVLQGRKAAQIADPESDQSWKQDPLYAGLRYSPHAPFDENGIEGKVHAYLCKSDDELAKLMQGKKFSALVEEFNRLGIYRGKTQFVRSVTVQVAERVLQ